MAAPLVRPKQQQGEHQDGLLAALGAEAGGGGGSPTPATIAILEASFSARDAASIFLGANRSCGANHSHDGPRTIRAGVNHR